MKEKDTFASRVLEYNKVFESIQIELPTGFKLVNPFKENQKEKVKEIMKSFYQKFYNDNNKRQLILGSSPARRGSAIIGVPFESAAHLQEEFGIYIDDFYINKSSGDFLFDVMELYGGYQKFYSKFYMNFVFPLGIVRINKNNKENNCNYYENKKLLETLYDFIVNNIKTLINLGIDTKVCYCIGSGENYKFLLELNKKFGFFKEIIPLEHPRFIMQYNKKDKEKYIEKYLNALNRGK